MLEERCPCLVRRGVVTYDLCIGMRTAMRTAAFGKTTRPTSHRVVRSLLSRSNTFSPTTLTSEEAPSEESLFPSSVLCRMVALV